jgi:Domain of unknown function (DUF4214)/RTX calcium-binding nonapeptide repeat (4 copies)
LVDALFENVLHGSSSAIDPSDAASLVTQLDAGTLSKGGLLEWFANRPEVTSEVQPIVQRGLWVENANALELDRLYQVGLDRGADQDGLGTYLLSGLDPADVGQSLVTPGEFNSRFGALDDSQFVTQIYENAFGRAPTAGELAGDLSLLSGGSQRGSLVAALADATNASQLPAMSGLGLVIGPLTLNGHSTNNILVGSSNNDTFQGAAGNDTSVGGGGSDTYSFTMGNGQDVIENGTPPPICRQMAKSSLVPPSARASSGLTGRMTIWSSMSWDRPTILRSRIGSTQASHSRRSARLFSPTDLGSSIAD